METNAHTVGFKPGRKVEDIVSLIRQLVVTGDTFRKTIHMSSSAVKTAFDVMKQEEQIRAFIGRGMTREIDCLAAREIKRVTVNLEVPGMEGHVNVPLDQAEVRGRDMTPDIWNNMVEHALEGTVKEWESIGCGIVAKKGLSLNTAF